MNNKPKSANIDYRGLQELIQKASGTFGLVKVSLAEAVVKSVDKTKRICVVDLISTKDVEDLEVKIKPEICDGDTEFPEVESNVVIAFTQFTEPFIITTSDLSEKDITVGNQSWNIQDGIQQFNDGGYKGIPIVIDPDNAQAGLLKKINNLESDLNDLKSNYNSILTAAATLVTVLSPLGGGPTPASGLLAYINVIISSLTPYAAQVFVPTTETEISNPNITHGKENPDA